MINQPNFLVIFSDQHRGDCLSREGRPGLMTPNLDFLAAEGACFRRAYSPCPACVPTRRSFLLGQSPACNGVVGMGIRPPQSLHSRRTLAWELSRSGYETAVIGKDMHQANPAEEQGFSSVCTYNRGRDNYQDWLKAQLNPWQGGAGGHAIDANAWNARPWHLEEWQHQTHWLTERCIRYLTERDAARPFFLVAGYNAPHPPLTPPRAYFERYARMEDLGAPHIGDWAVAPPNRGLGMGPGSRWVDLHGEWLRQCYAGYYGLINHLDDQFERVRWALNRSGQLRNTYVIYVSDHGEMLGDHHLFRKSLPYEGSLRVPLIVTGPDVVRDVEVDMPVAVQDLMPTILELAGLPLPEETDARSLAPLLRGEAFDPRPFVHSEFAEVSPMPRSRGLPTEGNVAFETGWHALTDGHAKYIWFVESGREQLFDLDRDPGECRDLAVQEGTAEQLGQWRDRLMDVLRDRPEGFTNGKRLIPGRPYALEMPHLPENDRAVVKSKYKE